MTETLSLTKDRRVQGNDATNLSARAWHACEHNRWLAPRRGDGEQGRIV